WIVKNKQQQKPQPIQETEIANSSQEIGIAQSAMLGIESVSYEQTLNRYERHQAEAELLYLELLQAKIKTADRSGKIKKKKSQKSAHIGLQDGWTRATIIVKEMQLQKLKELSLA